MAVKDLIVVKSNRLVEASYMLTLQEFKLVSFAIAKLDSRKEIPDSIKISASEWADVMNIPMSSAYRELKKASNHLFERVIILAETKHLTDRARWVARDMTYHSGEGAVTLYWSPIIKELLGELKARFTQFKVEQIGVMTSAYTIRIFELLMQFQSTGIRVITVENLRFALCVEDKYPLFADLVRRIIDPALKEINTKTNIRASFQTLSERRKIVSVVFHIYEEPQRQLDV